MSMTESEAIRIVVGYAIMEAKNLPLMVARAFDVLKDSTIEAREYKAIGTVSEFRELKEKATAKKRKTVKSKEKERSRDWCGHELL